MPEYWLLVIACAVVTANFCLLLVIWFLASKSIKRHLENQKLIGKMLQCLTDHETKEAENWMAFAEGISKTFTNILDWQQVTARLMEKDSHDLSAHDSNVAALLVEARMISAQLKKFAATQPYEGLHKPEIGESGAD